MGKRADGGGGGGGSCNSVGNGGSGDLFGEARFVRGGGSLREKEREGIGDEEKKIRVLVNFGH